MIITIDKIENIRGPGAGVFSKAAKACNSITTLSYSYLMSTGNQRQREEEMNKNNAQPKILLILRIEEQGISQKINSVVAKNTQTALNVYKNKFHPNEIIAQGQDTDDENNAKLRKNNTGSSFFKSISRDK